MFQRNTPLFFWFVLLLVVGKISASGATGGDVASFVLDDQRMLRPGDVVRFQIMEDRDEGHSLAISEAGEMNLPYLGIRQVSGFTCRRLAESSKLELEELYYKRATVIVGLDTLKVEQKKVFLLGEVTQVGPINLPIGKSITAARAVLEGGGFTAAADRENVKVIRSDSDSTTGRAFVVNMRRVLEDGSASDDIVLQDKDLIIVPRLAESSLKNKVFLMGAVAKEGPMELPENETLTATRAIIISGGFAEFANKRSVKILRETQNGGKDTIILDASDVLDGKMDKDVPLKPNDVILVGKRLINF